MKGENRFNLKKCNIFKTQRRLAPMGGRLPPEQVAGITGMRIYHVRLLSKGLFKGYLNTLFVSYIAFVM